MVCEVMRYPKEDLDRVVSQISFWEDFKNQKILITGSTGWIGSWLYESLVYASERLNLKIQFSHLASYGAFMPEREYDLVLHAAFSPFPGAQEKGTHKILTWAEKVKVKKFLLLSSGVIDQEIPDRSQYRTIKGSEENLALMGGWTVPIKIARIYTLAGPGAKLVNPYALTSFIGDAITHSSIRLEGYGDQVRSYLYMSDLVVWLLTILMKGERSTPYAVGSDRPVTIYSVAQMVAKEFETHVTRTIDTRVPFSNYVPDITACSKLGLAITVPLEESIKKTCVWFKGGVCRQHSDQGKRY